MTYERNINLGNEPDESVSQKRNSERLKKSNIRREVVVEAGASWYKRYFAFVRPSVAQLPVASLLLINASSVSKSGQHQNLRNFTGNAVTDTPVNRAQSLRAEPVPLGFHDHF